jgi:hypothetical protein
MEFNSLFSVVFHMACLGAEERLKGNSTAVSLFGLEDEIHF